MLYRGVSIGIYLILGDLAFHQACICCNRGLLRFSSAFILFLIILICVLFYSLFQHSSTYWNDCQVAISNDFLGYSVYNLSKVCAAFLFAPIALTSYSSTRLNFFVDIASFGPVVIFSVIFGDFFLYLCDFFWYDYALFWWVLYIGSRT